MGHIFISYSHKDIDYAQGLASHLHAMSFDVWIDGRLDYGSQWPHEIQKQLDTCDAFILVMSPRSFASDWVQSELQRAKRKLKPIFPLLLEGDEPWLSIESTQFYDVRGGKFPDNKFYSALKRVVPISQNAQTLGFSQNPIKSGTVAAPPVSQNTMRIGIAVIVSLMFMFVVCAGGSFVLFRERLFPAAPVPSPFPVPATSTLFSSPTEQPTLIATSTPLPTATTIPSATPLPSPTSTIPPPPTTAPSVVTNNYEYTRDNGNQVGVQRTESLDYSLKVKTVDLLKIEVSIPLGNSAVIFHILLDNVEVYTTEPLGLVRATSGLIDLSSRVSPGVHKLTISPEGIIGGDNTGTLWIYGANLFVQTNEYP